MKGNAFRLNLKLCLKSTGNNYVHSWVHLSCHSVALHDPTYRLSISVSSNSPDACVDRQVLCVSACIHCQSPGRVLSLPVKTGGDPPSFIHSSRNVKEVQEGQNVDEMAPANTLGPLLGLNIRDQNQDRHVFPGAASTPVLVTFRGLWESWMCLDESF